MKSGNNSSLVIDKEYKGCIGLLEECSVWVRDVFNDSVVVEVGTCNSGRFERLELDYFERNFKFTP